MAVRCGLEEVNALKWDNAAAHIKQVYESAITGKDYYYY
jgi:hypothetical protein